MSISLTCSPTEDVIDFEQAIHSAVAEVFSNAKIKECPPRTKLVEENSKFMTHKNV